MEKNNESNTKVEKSEKKAGLIINLLKKLDKALDDTIKYTYM